jgi:hypothetical protein
MLNAIPIKMTSMFFTEIDKSILKFTWKYKRLLVVKAILSKKSNVEVQKQTKRPMTQNRRPRHKSTQL